MPHEKRPGMRVGLGIMVLGVALCAMPVVGETQAAAIVIHQPIEGYVLGQTLEFKALVREKIEWLTLFFRFSQTAEFQARVMDEDKTGAYRATLTGEELVSNRLEYYLAFKVQDKIYFLPEDIPDRFFSARGTGNLPPLPAKSETTAVTPAAKAFLLGINGSASYRLSEKNSAISDPRFMQTENLHLSFQTKHNNLQLALESRLQYNNSPPGSQKNLNLANGRMTVSVGRHVLQAGDISLSGMELSLQALGRRGLVYGFDNGKVGLNLFTLSTQQLAGFDGVLIPKNGASFFGGMLGFSFFNDAVSIKTLGLTGKDDPALGINTGYGSSFQSRKGDLVSLSGRGRFFENAVTLDSELAFSRYDPDTTDTKPVGNDSAWKVAGMLSRGIFNLHASFKNIGKDFNSIGQQFLINDRRILDAGIGLRFKKIGLNAVYLTQRNNAENDSAVSTAKDSQVNTDLSWSFSDRGSLRLGYSHSDQNLPASIQSTISGGVRKNGYFTSMEWRPSQSGSLQVSAQRDVFHSPSHPEMAGNSLTVNAGGNFYRLEHWAFSFQLGMTQARYPATQKDARVYNALLCGDFPIVPRLLSLSWVAACNRAEPGEGSRQQAASVDGGINLHIPQAWKIGLILISLRCSYLSNQVGSARTNDYRIFLKCDFSLGKA